MSSHDQLVTPYIRYSLIYTHTKTIGGKQFRNIFLSFYLFFFSITNATSIAELKAAWDTATLGDSPYA